MSEITFEKASKDIDEIIKKLENGNLTLDESVKLFAEAEEKLKICEQNFNVAKGKITVIKDNIEKIFETQE